MTPNERAALALERAQSLVCLVRDISADDVAEWLAPFDAEDTRALVIVLAAMVPDDRSLSELLAWTDYSPPTKKVRLHSVPKGHHGMVLPCGTHSAYVRHRSRGEEPCALCKTAQRVYDRDRKRAARAQEAS